MEEDKTVYVSHLLSSVIKEIAQSDENAGWQLSGTMDDLSLVEIFQHETSR